MRNIRELPRIQLYGILLWATSNAMQFAKYERYFAMFTSVQLLPGTTVWEEIWISESPVARDCQIQKDKFASVSYVSWYVVVKFYCCLLLWVRRTIRCLHGLVTHQTPVWQGTFIRKQRGDCSNLTYSRNWKSFQFRIEISNTYVPHCKVSLTAVEKNYSWENTLYGRRWLSKLSLLLYVGALEQCERTYNNNLF